MRVALEKQRKISKEVNLDLDFVVNEERKVCNCYVHTNWSMFSIV